MSAFDSAVLQWLKEADIVHDDRISILDNGIQGADAYVRLESQAPYGDPRERLHTGLNWSCKENMEQEKRRVDVEEGSVKDEMCKHDEEIRAVQQQHLQRLQTEQVFQRDGKGQAIYAAPFEAPRMSYTDRSHARIASEPTAGIAWLRANETLRLQLHMPALPVFVAKALNQLPVKVSGLVDRGLLILEYPPSAVGYHEMMMHVGQLKPGASKPCPAFTSWPHPLAGIDASQEQDTALAASAARAPGRADAEEIEADDDEDRGDDGATDDDDDDVVVVPSTNGNGNGSYDDDAYRAPHDRYEDDVQLTPHQTRFSDRRDLSPE